MKSPTKKSKGNSKYTSEKKSVQDHMQSMYSSIGKIKEFVKQNSVIEIKPLNNTQDLKYLNKPKQKEDKQFQSEMGNSVFVIDLIFSNEENQNDG
jgi:hypothetical protein